MNDEIFLASTVVSLVGAYFAAALTLKKLAKTAVIKHRHLVGFLAMFVTTFAALVWVIGWLMWKPVPFGR